MITYMKVMGDDASLQRLSQLPEKLRAALVVKATALSLKLENKIKSQKLSGQVLKVRTGDLRRSIGSDVVSTDTSVVGRAFSLGVHYAAIHEYGYSGIEHVQAHTRVIKQAFGREIDPKTVQVRAYDRHVKYPERSFMRSSLREMEAEIKDKFERTVREVLKS